MHLSAREEKKMHFCELIGVSAILSYLIHIYAQITKWENALKQPSLIQMCAIIIIISNIEVLQKRLIFQFCGELSILSDINNQETYSTWGI